MVERDTSTLAAPPLCVPRELSDSEVISSIRMDVGNEPTRPRDQSEAMAGMNLRTVFG